MKSPVSVLIRAQLQWRAAKRWWQSRGTSCMVLHHHHNFWISRFFQMLWDQKCCSLLTATTDALGLLEPPKKLSKPNGNVCKVMSAGRIILLYFLKKDSATIRFKKYDGHPYLTEVNGMFSVGSSGSQFHPKCPKRCRSETMHLKLGKKKKCYHVLFYPL